MATINARDFLDFPPAASASASPSYASTSPDWDTATESTVSESDLTRYEADVKVESALQLVLELPDATSFRMDEAVEVSVKVLDTESGLLKESWKDEVSIAFFYKSGAPVPSNVVKLLTPPAPMVAGVCSFRFRCMQLPINQESIYVQVSLKELQQTVRTNSFLIRDRPLQVYMLGDNGVGKTTLAEMYVGAMPPSPKRKAREPKLLQEYSISYRDVNEPEDVKVQLWDVSGSMQGQKDQLLSQVFSSVDCVLLCFNLADESSLQHCQKWAELVKKHALHPDALFILVGLQQDRRFGEEQASCVLRESGEVQAVEMGAVAYLECSSKQDTGVKTVFQQAFRTAQKAKASRVKDRDHRICSTREICNLPCVVS